MVNFTPINEGTQVANIIVSNKDEIIKKLPLYASEDLKKVNILKFLYKLFDLGRCGKKPFIVFEGVEDVANLFNQINSTKLKKK